jgi:aminopeptidase N
MGARRRILVVSAFVLSSWSRRSSDRAQTARQFSGSEVDARYYDVAVSVDPDTRAITGQTIVHLAVRGDSASDVTLDLADRMIVDSAIDCARQPYARLAVDRPTNQVRLRTDHVWSRGNTVTVAVFYHGQPDTSVVAFVGDGDSARIATYGLPYSARQWWPSIDVPSQKADSVDIEITAPENLAAVSNGRLVRRVSHADGTATTHWAVRYPIYPDVISLAIARYATFSLVYRTADGDSMPMPFFVFPADEAKARIDFSTLPAIMAHHAAKFGEYPFLREKYGVAEFSFDSFREHQTIPSYGAGRITGDHRYEWILAHELAHQWFGNALTVRSWSDVWLNEGFATYAAWLWYEQSRGRAAYDSIVAQRMRAEYRTPLFVADSSNVDEMFTAATFFKGALVLHMLRHVLGDEVFFRALREYVAANRYGTVVTANFQSACEAAAGRRLDWFFQEWVMRPDVPTYRLTWSNRQTSSGYEIDVSVEQAQAGAPFTMPLDIAVRTAGRTVMRTIVDSARTMRLSIPTAERATAVVLDPDNWVLKR